MQDLVGRTSEIALLQEALSSSEAELIAVYGRRRVGKTYLVRTVYEKELVFELTGQNDGLLASQLENFGAALTNSFGLSAEIPAPESWPQAFRLLSHLLEPVLLKKKRVIFWDEFPWLDTPKSGFLAAFDHFWNSWASKQRNLTVVICGSAASWMIRNIVRNKGGLHNRLTRRIRLMPFNLCEMELFLHWRNIRPDRYQLLQLYMAMGGIPHYLKEIRRGESVAQAIDRICFHQDGLLFDEFKYLYAALFNNADRHIAIVRALSNRSGGMTRNEIMEICQINSGGTLTNLMDELLESGFIEAYLPFQKNATNAIYKLNDEYSLFYLKFMEHSRAKGEGTWLKKSISPSWKSWSGLAFESICLKHFPQIKKALGIAGVYTEQAAWRVPATAMQEGAQIDLLIDRQDNCLHLCEIKFAQTTFTLDKKGTEALAQKRRIFLEKTGVRKTVFITLLTTFGIAPNEYAHHAVDQSLTMDCLFESVS